MRFYPDGGYQGDPEEVYGDDGPCDATGYGLSDTSDILDGEISSYTLHSSCYEHDLFTETDYEGTASTLLYGSQTQVPSTWNDNLNSMWLYNFG